MVRGENRFNDTSSMNQSDDKPTTRNRSAAGKFTAGGGLMGVLVVIYAILQPILSRQLGIELPKIPINSAARTAEVQTDDSRSTDQAESRITTRIETSSNSAAKESPASRSSNERRTFPDSKVSSQPQSATKATGTGPLSKRIRPPPTDTSQPSAKLSPTKNAPNSRETKPANSNLRYGILHSIGRDRYISPAGLQYTPGSQEGHRLKHLERHTEDQPGRPGKHGVFDGGMEKTLEVLDKAYEKAKKGGHGTTKSVDDGRTIYTVDMGQRIGFVGGREGNRRRKPMARRVRLVLDGNRVITAYPL